MVDDFRQYISRKSSAYKVCVSAEPVYRFESLGEQEKYEEDLVCLRTF